MRFRLIRHVLPDWENGWKCARLWTFAKEIHREDVVCGGRWKIPVRFQNAKRLTMSITCRYKTRRKAIPHTVCQRGCL